MSSLDPDVPRHTVVLVADAVAKVYPLRHPWKRVSTQINTWKISLFLKISNALSFAFLWSWICAKFQVMRITIFFNCFHHFLETAEGGSQDPVIIRVPEHAVIVVVDPTTCCSASEEFEEIVYIEAIEVAAKECS